MKRIKKVLAVFLTCLLIVASVPLQSLTGIKFPDIFSFAAQAADDEEWNGPDYSDLTVNQYMSKMLLNYNYNGMHVGDETNPQHQLNYYLDLNTHSFSKNYVDLCREDNIFMTSIDAWEALTFNPANMTENMLDEKGYYTAVIMNILNAEMQNSELLDTLNNDFGKMSLSVSKSVISILKEINGIDIKANELKSFNLSSLTSEEKTNLIVKIAEDEVNKDYLEYLGKGFSFTTDALEVCNTAKEISDTICSYIMISQLGQEIEAVLNALYVNCPESNNAMKTALKEVCDVCSSNFKVAIANIVGTNVASFSFNKIVDDIWKSFVQVALGEFASGMLIGQVFGKAVSNFCFSSDEIKEQYYVMSAMVNFEELLVDTIHSLGNEYKKTESTSDADNFIQSVKLMFSTYLLDCDYAYKFVDIAQNGNIFKAPNNKTISECKEMVEWAKARFKEVCNGLTSIEGYRTWYEIDAPSAYEALFVNVEDTFDNVPVYNKDVEPVRMEPIINSPVAQSSFVYREENDGTITIIDCNPWTSGEIVLPETIVGKPIRAIDEYAFSGVTGLTEITLNQGLFSIGRYAFNGTNITNISIPNSVSSMSSYYNGDYYSAFLGAAKLKNIVFEIGMLTLPTYTLQNCTSVESVTLPDGLTQINRYAFYGCSGLKNVSMPDSVRTIGTSSFSGCTSLTEVNLPDTLTTINAYAFYNCTSLTNIEIPDSVTSMSTYAFGNCTKLNSIKLSANWKSTPDKDDITSRGDDDSYYHKSPFYGCTGLKNIVIPDGMKAIPKHAFRDCSSVLNIIIPNSVTSIGSYAFYGCSSVVTINISENVTSIGNNAFSNCTNLTIRAVKGSTAYNYAVNNNININELSCPHKNIQTVIETEPDCENNGYQKTVCTTCKEVLSEGVIPKLGHKFTIEVVYTEPTCTTVGEKQQICEVCGLSEFVEIEKSAHIESDWIIDREPNADEDGLKHKVCLVCQEITVTEVIPFAHHYTVIGEKQATCEEDGYTIRSCDICGKIEINDITATGHKYTYSHQAAATCVSPAKNVCKCELCDAESFEYFGFALCDFDKNGLFTEEDYKLFEDNFDELEQSLYDFDGDSTVSTFDKTIIKHITNNTALEEIIDINADGESNILDLVRVKKILAGIVAEDEPNSNADRNLDGETDSNDAIFVKKFILLVDLKLYV